MMHCMAPAGLPSKAPSFKTSLAMRTLAIVSLWLFAPILPATAQTNISWSAASDGDWTTPGNWTPAEIPNNGAANYAVTVNQTGTAYTIGLDSDITVDSLLVDSSDARISHTAGTLTIAGTGAALDVHDGYYRLQGGTIKDTLIKSLVLGTSGRFIVMGTSPTSYFDNVAINRTVDIGSTYTTGGSTSSGTLQVTNGLRFESVNGGLWFQGGGGEVILPGNQTISGVTSDGDRSEIVFNENSPYIGRLHAENGTLTIGPNVRIRVAGSGYHVLGDPDEGLIIQGEVYSPVSLRSILITGDNWVNQGRLTQYGAGQINLGGTFSTANLGTWSSDNDDNNGRIKILGTLDNTGATLDMTKNPTTLDGGSMTLGSGGVIVGGTIKAPTSTTPFGANAGNYGFGTLDGVTIDGYMSMLPGEVKVLNNLTINANSEIWINRSTASTPATLTFAGNQAINGSGDIVFQGSGVTIGSAYAEAGGTLTIGSDITVRTGNASGNVGISGADLINQGTISVQTEQRQITLAGNTVTNEGTMQITASNSSLIINASTIQNTGLVDVAAGTLSNSSSIQNSGVIRGNGTITGGVNNMGVIAPGESPGLLTIGDLTQTPIGTLYFEIAGLTRGTDYDALVADDILQLDGSIDVDLLDGFMPTVGSTFDLLDWNSAVFGDYQFDFSDAVLDPGLAWDTSSFESTGQLLIGAVAVPEPSSLLLVATGAAFGLFGCGWRWKRKMAA